MTAIPSPTPVQKFFDNNGAPLAFGTLASYAAGTTTPQATYVDSTLTTQNTNPIQLNFRGECNLWLDPTLSYKLVLSDSLGHLIWTVDNIIGALVPGTAASWTSNTFTTTAGQTVFTLSNAPNSLVSALVSLDGVMLIPSVDYTISGVTLTLTTPALLNQTLYVSYLKNVSNIFQQTFQGGPSDIANVYYKRIANYSGGTLGFVNSALRAETDVTNAGVGTNEWAFLAQCNNASAGAGAGNGGVGAYFQGNMQSTGATWGAVADVADETFTASTGKQGLVGLEVDCYFNGADSAGNRVGLQVIAADAQFNRSGLGPGTQGQAFYGILVMASTTGTAQSFVNGMVVDSATASAYVSNTPNTGPYAPNGVTAAFKVQGFAQWGLDTTLATISSQAIRLATGQGIAWIADGSYQMAYDGTSLNYDHVVGGVHTHLFQVTNGGQIVTVGGATPMIQSSSTFNNGAAAQTATLTNSPVAGNPTSWIAINDNGTIRHMPAW